MFLLNIKSSNFQLLSRQKGLALPLTLMLLFVMTLIAVATLRSTTMQENMSANTRLHQIAFNAAETALVEAERVAQNIRYDRRVFIGAHITPDNTIPNRGDTCENGYCTPAEFTSAASTTANGERWEDPDLDVWNDDDKHIKYANFTNTNLVDEGVLEAPKYIIEFLGNYDYKDRNVLFASNQQVRPRFDGPFKGNCRNPENNQLTDPNNVWPFCAADSKTYRITVRAVAGPEARQAVVLLQSIYATP